MKKLIIGLVLVFIVSSGTAFAIPIIDRFKDLLPFNDSSYDLGSNTERWAETWFDRNTTTDMWIEGTGYYGANWQIGDPTDKYWGDGTNSIATSTNVADAIDDLNETLSYLAPDDASGIASGALIVSGTTFDTDACLSAGNTNYKGGDAAGDCATTYVLQDASFTLAEPTGSFNKADEGTLEWYINGAQNDTYDLGSAFTESERSGTQTYPPVTGGAGNLTIQSVAWFNDFPKWQQGTADGLIVAGDLRQGWNYFYMLHSGLATNQQTNDYDIFYDSAGTTPTCTANPPLQSISPIYKYISGVPYYYTNSTFELSATSTAAFDNTYHQSGPLTWTSDSTALGSGSITIADGDAEGFSSPPAIGESFQLREKTLTLTSNERDLDLRASVTPRDPWASGSSCSTPSNSYIVDSYATSSTALYEDFQDEKYRLASSSVDTIIADIDDNWDNGASLSDGKALVYWDALWYPNHNFTSYTPAGPDYSGYTANPQVYMRVFEDSGANSGIQMTFGGLTAEADIDTYGTGEINVLVKLPGVSGWWDAGCTYTDIVDATLDYQCIKTAYSGSTWTLTFDTFSTADSGNQIAVKILIKSTLADDITSVSTNW